MDLLEMPKSISSISRRKITGGIILLGDYIPEITSAVLLGDAPWDLGFLMSSDHLMWRPRIDPRFLLREPSAQPRVLWCFHEPTIGIGQPGLFQQRKLMGSSAQNSSSVNWCRFRRRFRRRFREALQSQIRFNRVPEKVPEKFWEALVQSQVRFNRICGH